MEHPDITHALRDGYPHRFPAGDIDCPEMRAEFLRNFGDELVDWMKEHHPDLINDWMEDAGYSKWLMEMME